MSKYQIYHNPRCSKSRQTLEILNSHGVDVEVIEYLKTPPSVEALTSVIQKLGVSPQEVMRKKETEYKEAGLSDESLSETQQIQLMIKYPKVIERPIVIRGKKAVIGRPPENVNALIS